MSEFRVPWLLLAIVVPSLAAVLLWRVRDGKLAKQVCLVALGMGMAAALAEWSDFSGLQANEAHDRWDILAWLLGREVLCFDRFSAPLLALNALYCFLVVLATMRTKMSRVSFCQLLLAHAVTQAIFSTKDPSGLFLLTAVNLIFPWIELRQRRRSTQVFLIHAAFYLTCMIAALVCVAVQPSSPGLQFVGSLALVLAIMARCWTVPFHCGLSDLFDRMGFGSAILFSSSLVGPYLAVRLGMALLPDWGLQTLATCAVLTSIYASAMAVVQNDVRRMFCFLFLSHTSLILIGLETAAEAGVAAGLCLWLGSSVAIVGMGLTLRSVEARFGRLSLENYQGYYEHIPRLAGLFLITGLAFVGFPGTIGFVSTELLVDSVIRRSSFVGGLLVLSAALSSVAVLRAYFRLFTGHRHLTTISLRSRRPERVAILVLVSLLIGGSLGPQTFTESRFRAAQQILEERLLSRQMQAMNADEKWNLNRAKKLLTSQSHLPTQSAKSP